MNKQLSNKIKISSLLLMIMVIYLHAINIKDIHGDSFYPIDFISSINIFIQNLLSQGIARIAVPLFFIIAGYLFFKEKYFTIQLYKSKLKKRLNTLVIPYIFWSFVVIVIYFTLQLLPNVSHYFNTALIIKDLSYTEILYKLFFFPINYPLWFIRDLIYIVILSPLFFLLLKNKPLYFFPFAFFLWFYLNTGMQLSLYKEEPFLFFAIGAYIAIHQPNIAQYKISDNKYLLFMIIYLTILLVKTYLLTFYIEVNLHILHKISILLGIFVFWFSLDRIKFNRFLLLSHYTFLFYIFHEPMLTIVTKGGYLVFGKTALVSLILYCIAPLIVISILYFMGVILKKYKFYAFVTGNRV